MCGFRRSKAVHDARDAIHASYRNQRMPEPDEITRAANNAISLQRNFAGEQQKEREAFPAPFVYI